MQTTEGLYKPQVNERWVSEDHYMKLEKKYLQAVNEIGKLKLELGIQR